MKQLVLLLIPVAVLGLSGCSGENSSEVLTPEKEKSLLVESYQQRVEDHKERVDELTREVEELRLVIRHLSSMLPREKLPETVKAPGSP